MPRISLYRPEKGNDYKFMDKNISEMFTVGGTDLYFHKLLGTLNPTTGTADQPIYASQSVTNIQDLLFLENRDRKYDPEIYRIRGHYQVQNLDWNLSQFGLFLENDTINMTIHINDIISTIGRKPMSGDVFELPHLADYYAFNDLAYALPRYFVITDVNNATEGYSPSWFPHLYRLKCKKITDSQQFADILNLQMTDANGDPVVDSLGNPVTVKDSISQLATNLAVNDAVVAQAAADAPKSGFETRQFFTLAVDEHGKPTINTADEYTNLDASNTDINANDSLGVPQRTGYTGYLVGDGIPSNGYAFGFGIQFPANPQKDDFFLRTDFLPNRLFQFNGRSWSVLEDAVRMDLSNTDTRQTLKTSFINNTDYIYNDAVIQTYVTYTVEEIQAGINIIRTKKPYLSSYQTVPYISLKIDAFSLSFAIDDYDGSLVTSYLDTNPNSNTYNQTLMQITLPDSKTLPYAGQWQAGLYNNREAVRQSLSTVLKPKADF